MKISKKTYNNCSLHGATALCRYVFLSLLLMTAQGCSVIDEDQSDCGEQAKIDYELTLVTNITTELTTQLSMQTEVKLANALRQHLSDVFTDYAHDIDLSFYDTKGDSARLQHDKHIMNANQASYTLNLPMRQYMHLAAANIVDNELVTLENDAFCHQSMFHQTDRDTIDSHTTGLYTARQPMEVLEGVDQHFDVHLYMANCAAALVIDPQGHDTQGVRVYSTGFATRFNLCDSSYVYAAQPPIVRTSEVGSPEDTGEVAYCSVTFPSKEPELTRNVIETEEPFISQPGEKVLWEFRVYVPQVKQNGTRSETSITETVLGIKEPLQAGELEIIKGRIAENGAIVPDNPEIGASVTLDWQPGTIYYPEF